MQVEIAALQRREPEDTRKWCGERPDCALRTFST
jgi:hypothetical protein